jgi:hypothetical protein
MSKIGQPGSNYASEMEMVYRITGCLTLVMLSIDSLNPVKQVINILYSFYYLLLNFFLKKGL